ncbi:hypothetical protein B0I37DRAFT_403315 [Chaetomium sp. MPI-CAGE-AT-0009]|nr:hypothetical protein B0I37DRAFT_403315 [Chaetomium sp. MPI-CAGE-AT-0009]
MDPSAIMDPATGRPLPPDAIVRILPQDDEDQPQQLKVDILLEDPSTGSLFAAAPYTAPAAVEPTTDSSRFFALRVRDPASGHKATLGVGFEERSEAFDFGVALQEASRALGWAQPGAGGAAAQGGGNLLGGLGAGEEKRDLSLKEGETITVNLAGTRFGRRAGRSDSQGERKEGEGAAGQSLSSFALPPPPPPSAREVRAQKRLSAQQLGFDDGQFGEFA